MAQKDSTSLAVRNEELTLRQSASVMSDCTYHFIVRKWLDGGYYLKYSFQVQKNKSKFLGLNGTQLDIVNDTDVASIKTFRKEKIKRDVYLRPCGRDDLYLCFNQTRKLFELKTREHMYTNGDNKKMDDIEADGLIPHVQSTSFTVNGDEDNDVEFSETDSSAAPGNNLDDSPFVSEIFVKHADEDSVKGDPLGGFLCTGSRSDGTFLHAFCSLQPDGILAKDFSVKDKDILVSLNGKKTLGSFEYDHGVVLALFRTLPMTEKISMVIYNRKSETFTTIEFLLEGTKEDHFIVRKWLDGGYYLKYSFQVQKNKSKFLGLNGTQLDIVNDTDVASIKTFRKEKIKRDVYLRPCGRDDLYLCFNQTRKLFELKTREHKDNDDIDSSHSMIPHGESTYDEKTQSKITDNEILKRMLLQNIREENVVGISERDSAEVIDKNKLGKFFQRPNKNDYDKLDASPFVSEIFVKHPDEDSDKGDPLGGFLCTGSRSDGTFLHEFCSLQPDGILAKDLSVSCESDSSPIKPEACQLCRVLWNSCPN
uniref:PDZ domain-containing protein n=1 Tax=Magallana gigas TaxID=29159 RepID=K1PQ08_MAGGI